MEGASFISTWFPVFFLWFIIFMQYKKRNLIKKMIKNRLGGTYPMEEIVKKYIGMPVTVNCIDNNDFVVPEGIITSYNDGWITLKPFNKETETAINCNYIISIKPKKIKSKNK